MKKWTNCSSEVVSMRKIVAHLNADIAGHDLEVEFEVEDDATEDEIDKEAFQQVMNFANWYWEEVEKE